MNVWGKLWIMIWGYRYRLAHGLIRRNGHIVKHDHHAKEHGSVSFIHAGNGSLQQIVIRDYHHAKNMFCHLHNITEVPRMDCGEKCVTTRKLV